MIAIYADGDLLWYQGTEDKDLLAYSIAFEEEVNKSGSLSFVLPESNKHYSTLQKLKTTITIKEDGEEIWRGRILHDEKNFYHQRSVYCEGHLSFLLDSVVRPYESKGSVYDTFKMYLDQHNAQVNADRQFQLGKVTVTDPNDYLPRSSSAYPKTLNEITEKLVNSLGGYLIPRYTKNTWYLDYKYTYGNISDQIIRFGQNLLDISEHITAENLFTVLVPLGAKLDDSEERLTIKPINDGMDFIENPTAVRLFGRIVNSYTWDDVTNVRNLMTKGKELLNANIEMSVTLSIKAVDLHYLDVNVKRIHLGDMVRVVSDPHGLDTYFFCTKIKHALEDPSKTEYTFGVGFKALTDKQVEDSKQTMSAVNTAESASATASSIAVDIASNYVSNAEFTAFQTQLNERLTASMHYKGDTSSLPSGADVGDVYNMTDTGADYVWSGSAWDKLSETSVTASAFADLVRRVEALENA